MNRRKSGLTVPGGVASGQFLNGNVAESVLGVSLSTIPTSAAAGANQLSTTCSGGVDKADDELVADQHADSIKIRANSGCSRWLLPHRFRCHCCVGVVLIAVFSLVQTILVLNKIFPEPELVLNSKCKNPLRNWDGKVLDHLVWDTGFHKGRPNHFSVHREFEYAGNDTNHRVHWPSDEDAQLCRARPVVMWGTHHKTGTFLAKKIFAKMCGILKWCCLFHLTRDSIHAVVDGVRTEPVDGFGHNQWIWNPEALGLSNYRFIHFYRHPLRKIVSGFRYHSDGTEEWTKRPLEFHRICSNPLVRGGDAQLQDPLIAPNASRHLTSQFAAPRRSSSRRSRSHPNGADGKRLHPPNALSGAVDQRRANDLELLPPAQRHSVSPSDVWQLCRSVHLCETCCRLEHEVPGGGWSNWGDDGAALGVAADGRGAEVIKLPRYQRRRQAEYDFLCKYLDGSPSPHAGVVADAAIGAPATLQQMLTTRSPQQPLEQGLLVEAALDYYENLRMARIINETAADTRSLHVDLDELSSDFSTVIWRILDHLRGFIPTDKIRTLHRELLFYDLDNSPLYRWSMDNPVIKHVTSTEATPSSGASASLRGQNGETQTPAAPAEKPLQPMSSATLIAMLEANEEVRQLYEPVLSLMSSVLIKRGNGG